MYAIATAAHQLIKTDSDETSRTWKCTCGFWATVETKDAPDYHTPLAERFADHLSKIEAIESGAAWDLPKGHRFEIFHRKSHLDGQRGQIVLWAVWMGGFREVATWPCTVDGFNSAASWCDQRPTEKLNRLMGTYTRMTGNDVWDMSTRNIWV